MVVAALVLTACGSVATGASPSPTPSVSPGLGFDVVVTERDRTATLKAGQKLEMVLHSANGMTNWNGVRSSDTSVLMPIPRASALEGSGAVVWIEWAVSASRRTAILPNPRPSR